MNKDVTEKKKGLSSSWLEQVVTPWWIRMVLPLITWRRKATQDKMIYLTFDDGPTSQITDQLLENLKRYDANATFFCIGENVKKYPQQFQAIIAGDHLIGNHSHSHLNGWQTKTREYVADIQKCQQVLSEQLGHSPRYFRPPFGRISFRQWMQLRRQFEIVLWDILSMDYRPELNGTQVAENVIQNARSGSIVCLHDSNLAAERVTVALPLILRHLSEAGFRMCRLDQ